MKPTEMISKYDFIGLIINFQASVGNFVLKTKKWYLKIDR